MNLSAMVTCPNCKMRVMPKADGTCPSCQAIILQEKKGSKSKPIHPVEPLRNTKAVEKFTYRNYWKVVLLIQAGAFALFGLLWLAVGFLFVFPSGGVVRFGGMGWLFFILAPIGAIGAILQYRKATDYCVELSEKAIRVSNVRADWAEIVKIESQMTENDRVDQKAGIQLITLRGSSLFISALTENLPYISEYIVDHAINVKSLAGTIKKSAEDNSAPRPVSKEELKSKLENEKDLQLLIQNKNVIHFYQTTLTAWSNGNLATFSKLYKKEANEMQLTDFIKKYPPYTGSSLRAFLLDCQPMEGEYLISTGSQWFVLTNLRLYQRDGRKNEFKEITLADIDTYKIKQMWTGTLVFKMKSGQEIIIKKTREFPSQEFISELISQDIAT